MGMKGATAMVNIEQGSEGEGGYEGARYEESPGAVYVRREARGGDPGGLTRRGSL